jgi:hypothetical protein
MTEGNLKVIGKADSPTTSPAYSPKASTTVLKTETDSYNLFTDTELEMENEKKMKMKIASGHHSCTNHSQSNPL